MSKTPLTDAVRGRAVFASDTERYVSMSAHAERLEQDREALLAALENFVARYPNNVGATQARTAIAKAKRK